jgi:hypothetical protein
MSQLRGGERNRVSGLRPSEKFVALITDWDRLWLMVVIVTSPALPDAECIVQLRLNSSTEKVSIRYVLMHF